MARFCRPAAYSGLVGLKPTIGRIPRIGGFPQLLLDFEVVGGMARTVKDAWLLFRLMAGPDERIQYSLNLPTMSMGRDLDVPPPRLRILYVERFGEALLDPGIAASCGDAVRVLEHLGHDVREGCLPVDIDPVYAKWPTIGQIGLALFFEQNPVLRKSAGEKYVGFADQGAAIKATELLDIYQRVTRFREETALALGDCDVIVTPTCACMPWPAVVAFPTEIDGKPVGPRGSAVYSGWVNAARIPAINVPAALSDTGFANRCTICSGIW